jgi:uncharacterized protein (TIGR02145 family)
MKNVMKKKSKRFPLWGCKGLLSMALSGLVVFAFAQSVDVCADALPYTIASTVDASGASTYQWLENGQIVSGASAATYVVPSGKAAGQYTYIRQAKSTDCSEWQSSNEFMVIVFNCSSAPSCTVTGCITIYTDPRDGKKYKTVVMPDGRTWFAQNLNYTKDLTYNAYTNEANGKLYQMGNGAPAIGSSWCPAAPGSTFTENQNTCNTLGALYTWETAMMVDGKYADETKTSSAWDESWVSSYYYDSGAPATNPNADRNNARGGTTMKGGGRGICPLGWHIPTAYEWAQMLDKVEGDGTNNLFQSLTTNDNSFGTDVGIKLKSSATYTEAPSPWDGSWPKNANNGLDAYSFSWLYVPALDARTLNYYTTMVNTTLQTSTASAANECSVHIVVNSLKGVGRHKTGRRADAAPLRCILDK